MKNKTLKIALTALTLIIGTFVWQSCNSDYDSHLAEVLNSQNNIVVTPKYSIKLDKTPSKLEKYSHLTPYRVKNEDELKELIENIKSNKKVIIGNSTTTKIKKIKSRSPETAEGEDEDSNIFYTITVECTYHDLMKHVDVTSYISGFMVSWKQENSRYWWSTKNIEKESIDVYVGGHVNGTVTISINVVGSGPVICTFKDSASAEMFVKRWYKGKDY